MFPSAKSRIRCSNERDVHEGMRALGRLKPGVTLAAAQADMDQIANNLALAYPDADKGAGISLVPLKKDIVGDVQPFLWVLLGAVGFVLLIACVNVANLQLARATTRAREFAIRCRAGCEPVARDSPIAHGKHSARAGRRCVGLVAGSLGHSGGAESSAGNSAASAGRRAWMDAFLFLRWWLRSWRVCFLAWRRR